MCKPNSFWASVVVVGLVVWTPPAVAEHDNWELYMEAAKDAIETGDYVRATEYLDTALVEAEELGPEDGRLGKTLEVLAAVYIRLDRDNDAESLYRRLITIQENTFGPDHNHVAAALDLYAAFLRADGRSEEAEPMEVRARAIRAN